MPKHTARRSRVRNIKRRVTKKRGGMDPPSHRASSASSYHSAPPTYNETYLRLLAESPEMGTRPNRASSSNMGTQSNRASNSNMGTQSNRASSSNMAMQSNNIEKLKVASNRWNRTLSAFYSSKKYEDSWSCKDRTPCLWHWEHHPGGYFPGGYLLGDADYYLLRNNKNEVWATTKHMIPSYIVKFRDWARFTGNHAQLHGWEEFIFHGKFEDKVFPASVERDGKHVYPDGTDLAWQDAQMIARQRWNPETKKGTHEDLYNKFSAEFVIPERNNVPGKWLGVYHPKFNMIDYTAPEPFEFTFDMPNMMKRIQNMGAGKVGDHNKWAAERIANSTRDFITSLNEHVLTINYIWLYISNTFDSIGSLYIITRKHVYRSEIRFNSAGQTFTPLTFKVEYKFAEPLSLALSRIFISYCKEDINLFRNGYNETGHSEADLKMHRRKLQSIIGAIPHARS